MNPDILIVSAIGDCSGLSFFCGYYKGRCDEMDSQKTVEINVEPGKVTAIERVK